MLSLTLYTYAHSYIDSCVFLLMVCSRRFLTHVLYVIEQNPLSEIMYQHTVTGHLYYYHWILIALPIYSVMTPVLISSPCTISCSTIHIDCITVSTLPVKSTIDDHIQQLFDALLSSLRRSISAHFQVTSML